MNVCGKRSLVYKNQTLAITHSQCAVNHSLDFRSMQCDAIHSSVEHISHTSYTEYRSGKHMTHRCCLRNVNVLSWFYLKTTQILQTGTCTRKQMLNMPMREDQSNAKRTNDRTIGWLVGRPVTFCDEKEIDFQLNSFHLSVDLRRTLRPVHRMSTNCHLPHIL